MLTIVADENIPHVEIAVGDLGTVRTVAGRAITRDVVLEADVLLVRSVTTVSAALLEGTRVRFVGSATAGLDHVDADALEDAGIAFASAPGSNAASVVDYVLAALLATGADRGTGLEGRTLGVIGAGEVGGRLIPRARALGLKVVVCDPPRAEAGHRDHDYRALEDVLEVADVVTLHVPLTDGPHATRGLIDLDAVGRMKEDAWLVNAARGGVLEGAAASALARSRTVVLDVWPGEPEPDAGLVRDVALGTPHIAGYALDAKVRGTAVIAQAVRAWAGAPPWDAGAALPPDPPPLRLSTASSERTRWLDALARQAYDVRADAARFRSALEAAGDRAAAFAALRRGYPLRRELSRFRVEGAVPSGLEGAVRTGLGIRVV